MRLKEYSDKVRQTAIYPKDVGKYYVAMGLVDEAGEVSEKVDMKYPKKEIIKELGDTMWYLVGVIEEYNYDDLYGFFEDNRDMFVFKSDAEKEVAKIMLQHSTKIIGKLKKVMRDDNKEFTEDKLEQIHDITKSVMRSLIILVNKLDISFTEIMQTNIDKLFDRKERGVLQGSGDNR